MDLGKFLIANWWIFVLIILFFSSFFTINQGYVGVITMFGRYQRIVLPGLRMKLPILESVYKKISYQNRSVELEFQAITATRPMFISNPCFYILCKTRMRKRSKKLLSNL
jgi:regulator of protease activity HflC (stomatin/prohibitin superfamily)